jgi:putative ABC transport system permease protein
MLLDIQSCNEKHRMEKFKFQGASMFNNDLKIALRNLRKQSVYSFINITGLAIGMACFILIFLFARNEASYDRFHPNLANLYRVYVTEAPPDRDPFSYAETPAQMAYAFETSFPEVKRAVRLGLNRDLVRYQNATFSERIHLADSDFFEVFHFPLLAGEPPLVLQEPGAVVLTESMAKKYFGQTEPLGKQLAIKLGSEFHDFFVSGVAKDVPENSSIRFDFVIPFDNVRKYVSERALSAWLDVSFETYVELAGPLAAAEIEGKLQTVVKNHYPERVAPMITLHLQPMADIHLNSEVPAGFEPTSDPVYSYILFGIALLILVIACINFMTLAIGRSAHRSKEVGVRKVLGAVQIQLVKQFWSEAILMSFLALALSILLAELFLPFFNELASQRLSLTYELPTLLAFAVLSLLVGLIAGSYPAFVLARMRPALVIKGETQIRGARFFGHSLVVLQFSLSILLIIGTLVMADQLHYLRTKDLGFKGEQVVVIRNNSPQREGAMLVERFRQALAGDENVLGVAGSSNTFASPWAAMGFSSEGGAYHAFFQQTVDYDYLKAMGIELLVGRNFSPKFGTDSSEAIIVNEAMAKYFNWDSPLGQRLPGQRFPPHRVIGVVKDFNFQSLQNEIAPLVLTLDPTTVLRGINDISVSVSPRAINFVNVRLKPQNIPATVDLLKVKWQKVAPNQPFVFSFLDEDVEQQYREEERWSKIVGNASGLAILIACLGLFGLAALMAAKRTKEIGVRKVLGASVTRIVILFSKDFAGLVLIAFVVAAPVAFYVTHKWLQSFAYRIEVGWWVFALAGAIALLIALATVSTQAIRAAVANPVEALRYE